VTEFVAFPAFVILVDHFAAVVDHFVAAVVDHFVAVVVDVELVLIGNTIVEFSVVDLAVVDFVASMNDFPGDICR